MIFLKNRARQEFARGLAILLESDVPLHTAVALVAAQQPDRRSQQALRKAASRLREGDNFPTAMKSSGFLRQGDLEVIQWADQQGRVRDMLVALRLIAGDRTPVQRKASECVVESDNSIDLFSTTAGSRRKHINLI